MRIEPSPFTRTLPTDEPARDPAAGPRMPSESGAPASLQERLRGLSGAASTGPAHRPLAVYLHHTRAEYLPGIAAQGLVAGARPGIGDPHDGRPCTDGIYVVNPHRHIPDTGSAQAFVISAQSPHPDCNYPHDRDGGTAAGVFHRERIPPLRDAAAGEPAESTYSFTLPMTPRTAAGASALLGHHEHSAQGPAQSTDSLMARITHAFPAHAMSAGSDVPSPGRASPSPASDSIEDDDTPFDAPFSADW
jgi:hypothetical protein